MDKRKKTTVICASALLALGLISAGTIVALRSGNDDVNVYDRLEEDSWMAVADAEADSEDGSGSNNSAYKVPPITVSPKDYANMREGVPPEDTEQFQVSVTETVDEEGNVIQRPNWEEQKILAEDTDLTDPDTVPEYVNPDGTPNEQANGSESAANDSPKNGDTKTIDGETYDYVKGFGWVKNGSGNVVANDYTDVELSGNKVGY